MHFRVEWVNKIYFRIALFDVTDGFDLGVHFVHFLFINIHTLEDVVFSVT